MEIVHSPITYLIILVNVLMSIKGFQDEAFLDKHIFRTRRILDFHEYGRIIYSGFLHANWGHLIFNMMSLYSFAISIETSFGTTFFSTLYFAGLIGGNILSLILHRKDRHYAALGASGAVSGVIFASVILFPEMNVNLFLIPFDIPGWAFAALYTLFSLYGIQSKRDNIGHDAHLGGALLGIAVTLSFYPFLIQERIFVILPVLIPCVLFFYLMIRHPKLLGMIPSQAQPERKPTPSRVDPYQHIIAEKKKEMDRIVGKISQQGKESLNDYEKRFYDMNKHFLVEEGKI